MSTLPCPPNIDNVDDLRQLQRLMGESLFRPMANDDEVLAPAWTDGRSMHSVADSFLKSSDQLHAIDRLSIYARSYWFRILDCLYDDFPGLRSVLGEKRFHAFARAYLSRYPSASWTLRNLGQRLVQFIDEEPAWTTPRTAIARDIAAFEWAQILAFDEARNKPLHGDELLGSHANDLRLGLQPYLSLIELRYAVDDYFTAVRSKESGMRSGASNTPDQAPARKTSKRVPLPKMQHLWLAVYRIENDIYFKRISQEAYLLLTALRAGESVAAALETALANAYPAQDWAATIQHLFENAAALGWFCSPRAKLHSPSTP